MLKVIKKGFNDQIVLVGHSIFPSTQPFKPTNSPNGSLFDSSTILNISYFFPSDQDNRLIWQLLQRNGWQRWSDHLKPVTTNLGVKVWWHILDGENIKYIIYAIKTKILNLKYQCFGYCFSKQFLVFRNKRVNITV